MDRNVIALNLRKLDRVAVRGIHDGCLPWLTIFTPANVWARVVLYVIRLGVNFVTGCTLVVHSQFNVHTYFCKNAHWCSW